MENRLFTVTQTAERLGVKPPTVRAWILGRRIEYIKLGKSVRISAGTIEALISRGTVPALTHA
jgi:excisionase family DNA binding protein